MWENWSNRLKGGHWHNSLQKDQEGCRPTLGGAMAFGRWFCSATGHVVKLFPGTVCPILDINTPGHILSLQRTLRATVCILGKERAPWDHWWLCINIKNLLGQPYYNSTEKPGQVPGNNLVCQNSQENSEIPRRSCGMFLKICSNIANTPGFQTLNRLTCPVLSPPCHLPTQPSCLFSETLMQ